MKNISIVLFMMVLSLSVLFPCSYLYSEEIPKPTYDNSLIFSMTYNLVAGDTADIDTIRNQFGSGIYTSLIFSKFEGVNMDWHVDIGDAGNGVQDFKDKLDQLIVAAKQYKVGIHLTMMYGISRNVTYYNTAKEEDLRNCQWYNDNNISSQAQMSSLSGSLSVTADGTGSGFQFPDINHADMETSSLSQPLASSSAVNKYVFSTFSRYARKLRGHLDAKVAAAFNYLKQQQAANPDVLIIISAPGEAELNSKRLNGSPALQDYFCDYSPFAVLEFRDWVKHEGLYADGEEYGGEGYENGGSRYQGASGLANFNADFGTSFTSWDLKYYNWSLSDPVDSDYTDTANPDPEIIPIAQYTYNGMKPSSGSDYISGGFDPPRVMQEPGADEFYDLWHSFREMMVYHYVKDMTDIARASGFPTDQYYTHQIPGDYLFGTRPNDPLIPYLNARYYASASPMWTANVYPDNGLGVTLYDINFGTSDSRTTKYGIGAANAMSDNWAALEYNPEVIPGSVDTPVSPVSEIYNQMVKLYNGNPHVISFFKWKNAPNEKADYQYKDTNRGTAAKQFFDAIKDKARQPISTVFTPKKVEKFSGSYSLGVINLSWSSKIWTDLTYDWVNWGDFKEFVVYRGYSEDFTPDNNSEVVRKTGYSHVDYGFNYGGKVYYKLAAVNTSGDIGTLETISIEVPEFVPTPILSVSRERLNFGYITGLSAPPSQAFRVKNVGTGALNWTIAEDAGWLSCNPASSVGDAVVTVSIDPTGLAIGTYSTTITVSDPLAIDSPKEITVYLTVKNSSQNQLPFGSFDTPTDNSTIMSSIAVTGWVLDDVGVQSLKIYRDPISGEGKSLIFIGEANFVEGARTDVEAYYPDYPCNYKAGWGYMMLTNFLPNGGNGTFKIYAIAKDAFGYEITLGSKTIFCDNANAVKPFGAIDTPTQGGDASGSSFINWGWVLVPMPNSIPTDGSTINVYIDGVYIGHPKYNLYRKDIAMLFPGYANTNGAAGYYILDTTVYTDGVHTMQWTARDFSGNIDGIGSRYFSIQNTGDSTSQKSGTSVLKSTGSSIFNGEISRIPIDNTGGIKIKRGYNEDIKPTVIYPGKDGVITFKIGQLERIEVHFSGETLIATRRPIGSTLDSEAGVFYWQPGPASFGTQILKFVVRDKISGQLKQQQIKVEIIPDSSPRKSLKHPDQEKLIRK